MQNVEALKEYLKHPKNVVIVTHHKPDADALGSSLGLAGFLKKKGHRVQVITPSDYPSFLFWMPGNQDVLIFDKDKPHVADKFVQEADIIFCLDFSSLNRINELGEMVKKSAAKKVLIDHHLEPEQFADFEQWNTASASTAGLIYELLVEMNEVSLLDANIAACLYAGLMTDTGGFRHPNTRREEFQIASDLVGFGAEPAKISKLIYDTNTLARLQLIGYVLSSKLKVLPEFNTVYITLSVEELKQFSSQTGDTEGLVNYGLSLKGIRLCAFMYERKDQIKLSFRSLGDFNVNEFARKHFEGGGHKNAAGGQAALPLADVEKKFLELLPLYKDELSQESF